MKRICLLTLAGLLMTAGCMAEQTWGILPFMEEQGKVTTRELLITDCMQYVETVGTGLLDIRVEEALCMEDALYLAVTVRPTKAGTLVIPWVEDITEPGSMEVMDHPDYPFGQSVREYAGAAGCDHVVTLRVTQEDARIYGLEYAAWDHGSDGALRMVLQYGCVEKPDAVTLRFTAQEHDVETAQKTDAAELLLTCMMK